MWCAKIVTVISIGVSTAVAVATVPSWVIAALVSVFELASTSSFARAPPAPQQSALGLLCFYLSRTAAQASNQSSADANLTAAAAMKRAST
jgi:hypothetical protein